MNHVRHLGNVIPISIQPDEDNFTGRQCPNPDCEGYFKIESGTGLKGENLPCYCPYCGDTASQEHFWTTEQIELAKSVALRKVSEAFQRDLKKLEFDHRPKGTFGIGLSLKVQPGRLPPIHYYREKRLETEVVCGNCTLRYMVFGVFAFCPDCGQHNSLQILVKNLDLTVRLLEIAAATDADLANRLIENALEDCVSAFDGFGREICRVYAAKSTDPAKAERLSFQNPVSARQSITEIFDFDIATGLIDDEWRKIAQGFQKRHLLAHSMGVVDEEYVRKTGDQQAVVGRKVNISAEEVRGMVSMLGKLAQNISKSLIEHP